MKTPTWEPSAGNLLAFLNTNTEIVMTDLYTVSNAAGTNAYMTSGSVPVTVNGYTYTPGPQIDRSKTTITVGIEVATLQVDFYGDNTIMACGVPFMTGMATGFFDNGRVRVERLFLDPSGNMQGTILIFEGAIGQIVSNRGHVQIEVLSDTQLLDVMVPSAVYQPSCRNTFCDSNCTLNAASYSVSKAVSGFINAASQQFGCDFSGTIGASNTYFALGYVKFTSGSNAGTTKTVKAHSRSFVDIVTMTTSTFYPIQVGDAFTITAGCDKTMATCAAKFSNLANFSAEPFIPLPQTIT